MLQNDKIPIKIKTKVCNSCILMVITNSAETKRIAVVNLDKIRKVMKRQIVRLSLKEKNEMIAIGKWYKTNKSKDSPQIS